MFTILGMELLSGIAKGVGITVGTIAGTFVINYLIKKAKTALSKRKNKNGSHKN
ncbi:hypothetical protein M3215_11820 [Bacillus cytotoxicus]|uniref:Uncharacterized protein n=1 Tax=Bacillus cytotoxicus TaxID=580165 RepID=A0ACC6A834_9BACI|nr:hypothetical protein [Bacillus cytotoxicus]